MNENMDVMLRGRKFRKLVEYTFSDIRTKYDLRQIEIEVLLYLFNHPGSNSSEVYRSLSINKGHVSQAIFNLCNKGFLTSEQDKNDRRYVTFSITDLGRSLIKESTEVREATMRRLFDGISEEDLEAFRRINAKISENIDNFQFD